MLEENIKFIFNIYAFENQGADYFTFSSILFLLFFFFFSSPNTTNRTGCKKYQY